MSDFLLLKPNNPVGQLSGLHTLFIWDALPMFATAIDKEDHHTFIIQALEEKSGDTLELSYLYIKSPEPYLLHIETDDDNLDLHKILDFMRRSPAIHYVNFVWNKDSTVDITYEQKQFDELPQDWLPQIDS